MTIEITIEEYTRLKAEVERLTQRLGGVRLIVTEEMYDELNTKYLEQQHELHKIALTARQILDEKIDLKAEVDDRWKDISNYVSWGRGLESDLSKARAELLMLKAEVERLTAFATRTIIPNDELKAQVERLELKVFAFDRTIKQASCHYDNRLEDIRLLQAQVERLTKAGDVMATMLQFDEVAKDWNAAKEGKQP